MDTLFHRFADKIKGILIGFDRIVFKGTIQNICYPKGVEMFLNGHGVLNKDYKDWVTKQSAVIIKDAEDYAKNQTGKKIQYIASSKVRKETVAHEEQKTLGIQEGLIGVWSCLEACNTFKATFSEIGYPQIKSEKSRCLHLYFYYDHKDYGFMSIRLQTWAPYEIQVALNGREWLKRSLDKANSHYMLEGNKFLALEDYSLAQKFLDSQRDETRWVDMLSDFTLQAFPSMPTLLGERMRYYWILWQSEVAKDYIFNSPQVLEEQMGHLLRHAFITGTGDRVLRYFGRPVKDNGQPKTNTDTELCTRLKLWYNGGRIKHWVFNNSLKSYNELNVLRFECTINDPQKFKVMRTVTGDESGEKQRLDMRKGIADVYVRTQVSIDCINRFTEQVATLEDDTTVAEIISQVSKPVKSEGKRYRALDVTGKDLELLRAIADPKYNVDAITNKHLHATLKGTAWAKELEGKKLAARISRQLRLLREHGLIKKLPKQHRYTLTAKGRLLTTSLNQFLGAKLSDLSKLCA